jgi:hypothetical protein
MSADRSLPLQRKMTYADEWKRDAQIAQQNISQRCLAIEVPYDVLAIIFTLTDPATVIRCGQVCRA